MQNSNEKYSISSVPQADELDKVALAVEAVSEGFTSDQGIAEYVGFTGRQGRYYRLAAEIIGLISNDQNHAILTQNGLIFSKFDVEHRIKMLKKIVLSNSFFKNVLAFIEKKEKGVTREELLSYLLNIVEGADSTIDRRLSTIIKWMVYLNLIKINDSEPDYLYIYNNEIDEEDDYLDDIKASIYPAKYPDRELDIKEIHMQVLALIRKHKQKKIIIPEFQRNQVWKQQQKSRFIESLILNIPIPPFYMSEDLDGNMIVVDGLQRTTAINEFINNEYDLVGLEALTTLNGQYFQTLNESIRARIEDRDLLLYILRPSVPMEIVYDIFYRINANGSQLTRQEIRNCIYIGTSTKFLKILSETKEFKDATDWGIPDKRMKDREAILRFLAFIIFGYEEKYEGDLDKFLGQTMRRINKMKQTEIANLRDRFIRVMRLTFDFFGYSNFRLPTENSRGRVNIALMEAISYFFNKNEDDFLLRNKDTIKNNFKLLIKDQEFLDAIRLSTGSEKNVKIRFNKAIVYLSENAK